LDDRLPDVHLDSGFSRRLALVDRMNVQLDPERIKSWYLALTLNHYTPEQAMIEIAKAIYDGLMAS
jgi:hypothetical protein